MDENGTPTSNTGPSVDYNPGTVTGNYIYLESSSCYSQTAILESQCIIIDQGYDFKFAYHMNGATMGSLHIDIFVDGTWQEDIISAFLGNLGNVWNTASVDLSSFIGKTIKIRFRGITGSSFTSDIAIDDIEFINSALPNTTFDTTSNSIIVSGTNQLAIESNNEKIKDIEIYDLLGRKLAEIKNTNAQKCEITNLVKSNIVVLIKITLENNQVVYKKYLF